MKKIKELANVYLEYPDEKVLMTEEINKLKEEREQLIQTKIIVSREEILKRLENLEKGYTR
ncbi:MAG: hypothetical protein K6E99_02485 [Bacilli bacterium]|nr:hypothetical protein [Bacilli bacterium]